jgi:hypothetical protein
MTLVDSLLVSSLPLLLFFSFFLRIYCSHRWFPPIVSALRMFLEVS